MRWAVGPLGRWAVGPLVLSCVGLACLARPAHAGKWVVSYKWIDGSSSGKFGQRVYADYGYQVRESFSWDYKKADYTDPPTDYRKTEGPSIDQYNSGLQSLYGAEFGWASAKGSGVAASAKVNGHVQVIWKWVAESGDKTDVPETLNFW